VLCLKPIESVEFYLVMAEPDDKVTAVAYVVLYYLSMPMLDLVSATVVFLLNLLTGLSGMDVSF